MNDSSEFSHKETANDVLRHLRYLYRPGDVFEVCISGPTKRKPLWNNENAGGKKPIVAGWFWNLFHSPGLRS